MPEIITDNDAPYAFRIVKKICSEVGPGLPGSPQECGVSLSLWASWSQSLWLFPAGLNCTVANRAD